jgi:hypothetical protein
MRVWQQHLSYGAAKERKEMIHPHAGRLMLADIKLLFVKVIKPLLPHEKAMPNDGDDTPLRYSIDEKGLGKISSNIQKIMLMSV